MENRRTTISFQYEEPIWPAIRKWAATNSYHLKSDSPSKKLYQRGNGFWMAPMMFEASQVQNEVRLEAWIRANWLYRAMCLLLIPAEMGIESGGFWMLAPRNVARNAVNKLLSKFGQRMIP